MKLSSLLHKLCKGDTVSVAEVNKKGGIIYGGKVCGIDRDDPINNFLVRHIFAHGNEIVAVVEPREEETDEGHS